MKKFFLLTAVCALGMGFMGSCSSNSQAVDGAQETTDEATLADKNSGVDPATNNDDEAAIATMDDREAVVDLENDNVYRPDNKVERLTVLDFNATWCGPCKQFAPAFEEGAAKFGQLVDFVSVDVDVNPETAKAFGVESIPTVIFIWPNGKTERYVGTTDLLPAEKFVALVHGAL